MMTLYRVLVALHPGAFRLQFGQEMELIFEESGLPPRLLLDVLISLGRQWLLRTQVWIFALAAVGGLIPLALGFGFLRLVGGRLRVAPMPLRPRTVAPHVSASITEPFVMLTAVIAVMFISGTMILAIAWFGYSQQRRKRA